MFLTFLNSIKQGLIHSCRPELVVTDPERNELKKYSTLWTGLLNFNQQPDFPFELDERFQVSQILNGRLAAGCAGSLARIFFGQCFVEDFGPDPSSSRALFGRKKDRNWMEGRYPAESNESIRPDGSWRSLPLAGAHRGWHCFQDRYWMAVRGAAGLQYSAQWYGAHDPSRSIPSKNHPSCSKFK